MKTHKRLPRKKKKAMRLCMLLETGNPVDRILRVKKSHWVSAWRYYKSTANTLTMEERRDANKIKIKNL